jgi:serine/threonine protein kinase
MALARLQHPNILRVLEVGEFEGSFFAALEYVQDTLGDHLVEGPFSGVQVARLTLAVGSALQHARDQGMLPRTLTVESIFLTDENEPKLGDFCLLETETYEMVTPLRSAPPEWLTSGAARAAEPSQVYRIGALMYEMLTATPPFARDDALLTVKRVLHDVPEPPRKISRKVPRDLDKVCMKCMAKLPADRYATLQDLLDRLSLLA